MHPVQVFEKGVDMDKFVEVLADCAIDGVDAKLGEGVKLSLDNVDSEVVG